MKKLIFLTAILFFIIPTIAIASPYIVCSCQDNVEQYSIILDGAATPIIVDAITGECTNNQKRLSWDVGNLAEGQHNIEVKAKNVWGESTAVPFEFNKSLPATASGIGLSAEQ